MDNQMAMEPEDLKNLVNGCNDVYEAMGSKERVVLQAEVEQKAKCVEV